MPGGLKGFTETSATRPHDNPGSHTLLFAVVTKYLLHSEANEAEV